MIKQNTGSLLIKFLSLMWKQCEITYLKIVEQCMLTRQAAWAAHSTAALQLHCSPEPILTLSEVQSVSSAGPTFIFHIFCSYQLWAFNPQVSHHWQDRILSYLCKSSPHPQVFTVSKTSLNLHSKNCKSRTLHTSNPLPSPPFICIIWL